jgi:poly(hydroxyalkanoate) depolymerase family esterase
MKVAGVLLVLFLGTAFGVSATVTTTTLSSSENPSTYGQAVTFTAVVSSSLGAPPNGETVTFLQGKAILGTGALGGGTATYTTSTLAAGGVDAIKAVYAGDSNFASSTSKAVSQVVNKATTTTTVASSQNPSDFGQSVILTANVTPEFGGAVTGTVTFSNGSTKLGTATLSGGAAGFMTTKLAVGAASITAVYNGSSSFTNSTSNALNQTVNQASTSTALASTPNPSNSGQSVTFTATVTPQFSGSTVTGTVTFYDGTKALKTAIVTAGAAKLTTSTLTSGSHSITATYNGSTDFTGSTASLTQTVNGKAAGTYIDSTLTWDGVTRYYEVYLPANLPANPPMVFMLHGTRTTSTFDPTSVITLNWGWPAVADKYGFILVKPASTYDATSHQWNWNSYFMDAAFPAPAPDDSGFLRQLIVNLTAQYNVNPSAVFVAGFSSGAQMAHRVGVEISDLVAAIAPTSGQLVGQQVPPPGLPGDALAPVSVQEWHGTLDTELPPCNYGTTKYSGVKFTLDTVDDTFNYWVQQNSCNVLETTQTLCTNDAPTPGLSGNIATGCGASNVEVQFIWEPNIAHSFQQQNDTTRWLFFASHEKQP